MPDATQDQRRLAKRVAQESSNVVVKMGRTNGRPCLHLNVRDPKRRYSDTIYDEGDWDRHPERRANRGKAKEDN